MPPMWSCGDPEAVIIEALCAARARLVTGNALASGDPDGHLFFRGVFLRVDQRVVDRRKDEGEDRQYQHC